MDKVREENKMNEKSKAKEIIEKFYRQITGAKQERSFEISMYKKSKEFNRAKQCALIATGLSKEYIPYLFWDGVEDEINKL